MTETIHVTDVNFEAEVMQSSVPVLVDFWAPWCGPCKALAPTIDKLAEEYAGRVKIAKLDVDESPRIRDKHNIRGLPTIVVFDKGKEFQRLTGGQSKGRCATMLDAVLGDLSEEAAQSALVEAEFLGALQGEGDLTKLKAMLEKHPSFATQVFDIAGHPMTALTSLLSFAAGADDPVDLLLDNGAQPLPAELAALGRTSELRDALKADPDMVNRANEHSLSPLQFAAKAGHLECLKLLLQAGADLNFAEIATPPLIMAMIPGPFSRPLEIVKALIEGGADVDIRGGSGATPLHLAVSFGDVELVEYLISQGADPTIEDFKGKSALEVAHTLDAPEIAACLEQAAASTKQTRAKD